jgi:hypothetical protein
MSAIAHMNQDYHIPYANAATAAKVEKLAAAKGWAVSGSKG